MLLNAVCAGRPCPAVAAGTHDLFPTQQPAGGMHTHDGPFLDQPLRRNARPRAVVLSWAAHNRYDHTGKTMLNRGHGVAHRSISGCMAFDRRPRRFGGSQRTRSAVGTQLEETKLATVWAEGRAMPLEQAIAYALEEVAED